MPFPTGLPNREEPDAYTVLQSLTNTGGIHNQEEHWGWLLSIDYGDRYIKIYKKFNWNEKVNWIHKFDKTYWFSYLS